MPRYSWPESEYNTTGTRVSRRVTPSFGGVALGILVGSSNDSAGEILGTVTLSYRQRFARQPLGAKAKG
jgi:hypothetical protein